MDIDIMLVPDFFFPKWTKSSDYIYLILQPYLIQKRGEKQLLAYIQGFNYPGAKEGSINRPKIKLRLFNREDLNNEGQGFDLNSEKEYIPVPLPDTIKMTLSLISHSITNNSSEPILVLPAIDRDYRSFSTLGSHSKFVTANQIYPQKFAAYGKASDYYQYESKDEDTDKFIDDTIIPYRWWKPDDDVFPFPYQPENYDGEATFAQMLFHQMRQVAENSSFKEASMDEREGSKLEVQLRVAFMFGKLLRIYEEEGQPLFSNSQPSEIMHVPNLLPNEDKDNKDWDEIFNEDKKRRHTNVHSLCGLVFPLATRQEIENLPVEIFSENLNIQIKLDLTVPDNNQQVIFSPNDPNTISFDPNTISFPPIGISNNPVKNIFEALYVNAKVSQNYNLNVRSFESIDVLPDEENNLVLAAKINDAFSSLRIFNNEGIIIINKGKDKFIPDENLSQQLDAVLESESIDEQIERELIQKIKSSLGYVPTKPTISVSHPEHLPDPTKLIFVLNKSQNLLFDAELTRAKNLERTENFSCFSYFPKQDQDSDPKKRGSRQRPPLNLLKWSDYASVSLLTSFRSEDEKEKDIQFEFKLAITGRFRPYRQFQDINISETETPSKYLLIFEPEQRLPNRVIKKLKDELENNGDIKLFAFGLTTSDEENEPIPFDNIKDKLVHFHRDDEGNLDSERPVFFFDELNAKKFSALSTRAKFLIKVSGQPIRGKWQDEEFDPQSDNPEKSYNYLWRSQSKSSSTSPQEDIEFNVLSFNLTAQRADPQEKEKELAVLLWYEKEFDFHLACSARHLCLPIFAKTDAIKNSWLMNDSEGPFAEVVAVDGWNHKELNIYFKNKDAQTSEEFQFLNPQSMLLPTSESDPPLPASDNKSYILRKYLFSTSQEVEDEKKPVPFPLPDNQPKYTLAYPLWPKDYQPLTPPRISQFTKDQNGLVLSLGFEHQYGTQLFGKDPNDPKRNWEMHFTPWIDWIFTDPTTIKKPAEKLSFVTSTPLKLIKALEAKKAEDIAYIRQKFRENEIRLSDDLEADNIQTQEPNKEWTIKNPGEKLPYIIRNENNQMNVYRDESFFLTFSIPKPIKGEDSKLQLLIKGSWIKNDANNNSMEPDPLAVETRKARLEFQLSDSVCLLLNGYVFDWRYDEDEVDGSGHDRNFSQKLKPVYSQKRIKVSDEHLEKLLEILKNERDDFIEIDLGEKIDDKVSLLECQLELQRPENLTYQVVSSFQLWNAVDGKKSAPIYYEGGINSVNFSPTHDFIVTASNDNTARVWDFQGQEILVLNHPTEVTSAQFSSSGLRILTTAIGDSNNTVKPAVYIWNLQGLLLRTLPYDSEIKDLQLSPNSIYFLTTASNGNTVTVFDFQGKEILMLTHSTAITSAQFSSNGDLILTTATNDQNAYLWDLQGKETLLNHSTVVTSAQFSPDGESILTTCTTTSEETETRLWDIEGNPLDSFNYPSVVTKAQFSPNGEFILTIARDDSEARLWNLQEKQQASVLHTSVPHPSAVSSAQFSPNGASILTTVSNGNSNLTKVWIWNVLTGKELAQIDHKAEIEIAKFSPDSQIIVTASTNTKKFTDDLNKVKLLRPKLGNQDTFMFPESNLLDSESWKESFEDVSEKLEVRQALLRHLRSLHLFRNYITPSYTKLDGSPLSDDKRDIAYRRNLNLLTTRSFAMAPEGFLDDEITEIGHAIVPLAFLPLAHDPIFNESTQEIFRLLLEVLSSYEQLRLNEFNGDEFKDVEKWRKFFKNNNGRLPITNLIKAIASSLQPIPRNDLEEQPNNLAENFADQWRTMGKDVGLEWPQQYIFNLLKDDLRIYAEAKALLVHALKDNKEDSINLETFPNYFYKLEVTKDVTEQDINEETLSPLSIDIDTFTYQQTTTYKPQNPNLSSLLIGDVLDDLTYDNEFSIDRVRYFSGEEFIESLSQKFIFELKTTNVVDDGGINITDTIELLNQGIRAREVPDEIRTIFQDYGRELSVNSYLTLPLSFIFEINENRDRIDSYIETLDEERIPEYFKILFNRYYIGLSSSLSISVLKAGEEWEIVDNDEVDEQELKRTFIIYKVIYKTDNSEQPEQPEQIKLEVYERDRERFGSEWWIRNENDQEENDEEENHKDEKKTFVITVAGLKDDGDGKTEITSLGVDEIKIAEERLKPVIRLKENVLDIPLLGKKTPGKDALVKLIARSAPSQALIVFQGIFGGKTMSSDRQLGDREYSCELRDPSEFNNRLERKNPDNIKEPSQMIGVREDGSRVVQSFRYPDYLLDPDLLPDYVKIWTKEKAQKDCESRGGAFDEEAKSLSLCLPSLNKITTENPFVQCDSTNEVEFVRTPKVLSTIKWPQVLELDVVIVSLLIAVNTDEEGQLQRDRLLIRRRPTVDKQNDENESSKILPPFTITEDQDDIKELRDNGSRAVSIKRLEEWLEPEQPQDPNIKKLNLVDWMSELVQRNLTLKEPEGEKWSDGYITFTRNDEEEDSDDNQKPILDKIELPERKDLTVNSMRVSLFRPVVEYDLKLYSLKKANDIRTKGKGLVIIAKISDVYYVRIFDSTGSRVIDKGPDDFFPNEELTQKLDIAFENRPISNQLKRELIQKITSSLDYTLSDISALKSKTLHLVGVEVPVIAGEKFSTIGFRMVRNDEEDFDPRFIQFSRPAQRPAPIMATKIEDFKGRLPENRFLFIPTDSTNGWSIETLFSKLTQASEKNFKEPKKLLKSIIRVSIYHVDDNPSPRLGLTRRDGALTLGKRLINETGYKRPFSEAKLVFRFNEPNVNSQNEPIYLLKEHLLYWINIKCFTINNIPFLELLNIPAKPEIIL